VPVQRSKDSDGPYYQWGESGKKYHYTAGDAGSRRRAREKAKKQGQAAHAAGYDGSPPGRGGPSPRGSRRRRDLGRLGPVLPRLGEGRHADERPGDGVGPPPARPGVEGEAGHGGE